MRHCDYCRGPYSGSTFLGRPWPDRAVAAYCCYGCLSLGEANRDEQSTGARPRFRIDAFVVRLGIGVLVSSQSMIFGLAINLEEQTSRVIKVGVQGAILAGTLLVGALLAPPLIRNAISELRRGRLTIESLFLLTMAGAMAASLQSFITGRGPIYFEVVTILLVVYALGKAIGAHSRAAALVSTQRWAGAVSTCRIIDRAGQTRPIEVGLVLPGDHVEVRPGEAIAVDGLVRAGVGFVSEAAVSGEPFAVVRRPGDRVLAGMASYDATFQIEVTAAGAGRQIDQLLDAVEQARGRPTSLQGRADQLGQILFPLVVAAAIVTFGAWTLLQDWQTGLFNAMSVLLVACPCALGLATPIVIWSALNRLGERGLVAHTGDLIERLAVVDQVFFDKTGTLTDEQFSLVDVATFGEGEARPRILGLLSLVEEQSGHPVARPFAQLPRPFLVEGSPRIISFTVIPGCGVAAEVEEAGAVQLYLRIGRPEWIAHTGSAEEATLLTGLHAHAGHRIDCDINGKLVAIALVAERLRDSVPQTFTALDELGVRVYVLTGDTTARAAALALRGVQGSLLPDDKRQRIAAAKEAGGKPLMIGDGINDASALAIADAGIALASGADLANSAATATLYHDDLRVVPWAIALSREAVRTVRRNLWRAAGYNLIGISLAACGILHPIAAALLMIVSSLLVAWSSVRFGLGADMTGCTGASCSRPVPTATRDWAGHRAAVHGMSFALQALVLLLLLQMPDAVAIILLVVFAIVGATGARAWLRAHHVPHWLDMTFAMLTLGNLGMLLGWWADNDFARLHDAGCCDCVNAMRQGQRQLGMWLGMLLFANLAMLCFGRQAHPEIPWCKTAMLTGGNLGMIGGMILGAWVASRMELSSMNAGALSSLAGMTLGMVGGMLTGTEVTRAAIGQALRIARMASIYPASSKQIAGNVE